MTTKPDDEKIDLKLVGIFSYFQQKPDFAKCIKDIKQLLTQAEERGYQRALEEIWDIYDERIFDADPSLHASIKCHVYEKQLKQKSGGSQ